MISALLDEVKLGLAEGLFVPGIADEEVRIAELFVKYRRELLTSCGVDFVLSLNEEDIVAGSSRLGVGINAVSDGDCAETVAHLLNRPVNHALVGLFSADVKHLVESVLEHYRRRLLVEAGDFNDIVNAVTVETGEIRDDYFVFLAGLYFAYGERAGALGSADGQELKEAVVRKNYAVVGVERYRHCNKILGCAVAHVVNREISRVTAQLLRVYLERACAHAEHPAAVLPDSGDYRSVKALFEFAAKLGGAAGHGLNALHELFFYLGRARDALVYRAVLNVVAEHLPVVLEIMHHRLENGYYHCAQVAHVSVHQRETQLEILHICSARILREHYLRGRGDKGADYGL